MDNTVKAHIQAGCAVYEDRTGIISYRYKELSDGTIEMVDSEFEAGDSEGYWTCEDCRCELEMADRAWFYGKR